MEATTKFNQIQPVRVLSKSEIEKLPHEILVKMFMESQSELVRQTQYGMRANLNEDEIESIESFYTKLKTELENK